MARSAEDKQAIYYSQELSYLRQSGAYFAQKYPKVASRLDVHAGPSQDPHVERLVESFAYLTARLRRDLDERTAQMTHALLAHLYPNLVHIVPSMTIAQFQVDPHKGKLTDGYLISRGAKLQTGGDAPCQFRSCYDVTLWPIAIADVNVVNATDYDGLSPYQSSGQLLRLTVTAQGTPLNLLSLKSLQLHIAGEAPIVKLLCDLLMEKQPQVYLSPDGGKTIVCGAGLSFCGVDDGESVLPASPKSHGAYGLIQEYFTFPQKFHFIRLENLDLSACTDQVDIFITLNTPLLATQKHIFGPHNFLMGCTPTINLFDRISEPVRLNHETGEYRLVPDLRRERTTEVYQIKRVSSAVDNAPGTKTYASYFSATYATESNNQQSFWVDRRKESIHDQMTGTDVWLSFVNLDFDVQMMEEETVFAHITCTNRSLAEQIPPGAPLQIEEAAPTAAITCLERPTQQLEGPTDAGSLWALVNALSLNGLFMADAQDAVAVLQDTLLMLGARTYEWGKQEVGGIVDVRFDKVVRRLRPEAWRGFAQGIEVTVTLDESAFTHHSPLVFGHALNQFFHMYVSPNSFTQLVFKSITREGEWHRWPLIPGSRAHL